MKRRIVVFALLLAAGLYAVHEAMLLPDSGIRYDAFYEEKQDIDVFFMGTSHVIDGVYPIEIWRDYGITGYNLANSSETMEATYWTLRLALERHTPRVVVLDTYYIDRLQSDTWGMHAYAHMFLDRVPLSWRKVQAVWSLYEPSERAEYIFPLDVYHTRWEEMLFGRDQSLPAVTMCLPSMRGAELRAGRRRPAAYERTHEMDKSLLKGEPALRKIVELCREKGIELVLTVIPYPATEEKQLALNAVQTIADEYGVPYWSLLDEPELVDFEVDCYDAASHLNPDGAAKVSAYMGKRLSEEYGLADHRGDPAYDHWNEALREYEREYHRLWAEPYGLKEGQAPVYDE